MSTAGKSPKYVYELVNRKSFADFLKMMNGKTDMKEWTETWALYRQIREITRDTNITSVFDIGCGKRPTLGTLVALNLKSIETVYCIDPQIDVKKYANIQGMHLYKQQIESFEFETEEKVLVVCNHAHVSKKAIKHFLKDFGDWVYITTPCCLDNKLDNGRFIRDHNIWSPKNEIYIFEKYDNDV